MLQIIRLIANKQCEHDVKMTWSSCILRLERFKRQVKVCDARSSKASERVIRDDRNVKNNLSLKVKNVSRTILLLFDDKKKNRILTRGN